MATRKSVVVTGVGATTPLGGDAASFWEGLLAGRSGVRKLTEDWANDIPVKIAARVAVEPSEVLKPVEIRRLDRSAQFSLIAAREAWKDAGFEGLYADAVVSDKERTMLDRLRVKLGIAPGDALALEEEVSRETEAGKAAALAL